MSSNIFTFRLNVENKQQVRVTKSGEDNTWAGNPTGKLDFKLKKRQRIHILCQDIHNNNVNESDIRELGHLLFTTLFDDSLRVEFLNGYHHVRKKSSAPLRLELDINETILPELAALPWEFLCVPSNNNITGELWLGTDPNVVLSRRSARWQALPRRELAHDEPIRIAVLVADPSDKPGDIVYNDLWQQVSQLAINEPELFVVKLETEPTKENLDALLEDFRPHIFHFIGYGRSHQPDPANPASAQIAVLHDSGQARWVSAAQFSNLFARHRPDVVLFQDAATADLQPVPIFPALAAQAMSHDIAVAVTLQYPLGSQMAHRFCCELYRRLAQNEPIDKSVQEGRFFISDLYHLNISGRVTNYGGSGTRTG